jgi:protein-S-isoprenylcysteine O-methyltransferase Ste14
MIPVDNNEPNKKYNSGEHKLADAGQLVIAVLFLSVYIADTFFLRLSTFLNDIISDLVRIPLGLLILFIAGFTAKKGHDLVFKKNENQEIIKNGVFAVVRHPIYSSEIMVYSGLLVLSLSLISFCILIIGIAFIYYISKHEEKLLLERFGSEYVDYMKKTPMFIPCLHRRNRRKRHNE